MSSGIHSTVRKLQARLLERWCPKWYGAFAAPSGGFYERLGRGFMPVSTGQRRLVTQCRQLAIYSDVFSRTNNSLYGDLKEKFDYILARYHDPQTGLWHFSLDEDGAPADRTCDLYALSFVVFSFSHYYRATGDERARDAARGVHDLIDSRFRLERGLAEALGPDGKPLPKLRRQNPHMHLFEACLFAHRIFGDDIWLAMADDMADLFYAYFFNAQDGTLVEFFADDLTPDPQKGHDFEPGHFFEWVWLLKKHAAAKGDLSMHDAAAMRLFDWANAYGWDAEHGGIYDVLAADGRIIADTKRIWPFCEALKANALMLTLAPDRQAVKDRVADMVAVFNGKYMQERGFWTESLNRDLTPMTDYMPGTTPYHVYFGITETMDALNARGGSKSLGAGLELGLYGLRRRASSIVRRVRGAVAGA